MLADSYIVPECIVRPGSFGGLMALYESNFIKLDRLTGMLADDVSELISIVPGDERLMLAIESASKYTRCLRLTYLFEEEAGEVADPDLIVRVYLDARMTEVRGWANYHRHRVLDGLSQRFRTELDRRWSENMMFSKWLDYLFDCGHSFTNGKSLSRVAEESTEING